MADEFACRGYDPGRDPYMTCATVMTTISAGTAAISGIVALVIAIDSSPPTERRVAITVWAVVIAIAVTTLLGIMAGLLGPAAIDRLPISVLLTFGAAGAGVCGGLIFVARAVIDARRPSPVLLSTPLLTDSIRPETCNVDTPEPPCPAPGWSALSLHLRYELEAHAPEESKPTTGRPKRPPNPMSRWRANSTGEVEIPGEQARVPAPGIAIDGTAVQASWTRMWIQLLPGIHRIYATVGAPRTESADSTRVDPAAASRRDTVILREGETHHLDYVAHIRTVAGPESQEWPSYRVDFG
ncbi:hypothetical protein AB0H42_30145 [Nocardia sp. NPDC050799]|uniref:hypothetical protein n=1 Tax=Nocardia sp. NPDC050799 TaxID=3154842 RepID=UPI00340E123B